MPFVQVAHRRNKADPFPFLARLAHRSAHLVNALDHLHRTISPYRRSTTPSAMEKVCSGPGKRRARTSSA